VAERAQQREGFTVDTRITLLEGDADSTDAKIDKLVSSVDTLRQIFTGILVSVVVASIMLAINLAVRA
jgi:hypothetical protein